MRSIRIQRADRFNKSLLENKIVGFVQSHGKDTGWKREKLERFKEKVIRQ